MVPFQLGSSEFFNSKSKMATIKLSLKIKMFEEVEYILIVTGN